MKLLGKWEIKHLSPRRLLITGAMLTLMIAVTFVTLVAATKWEVTLNDSGNSITLKTTKSTVGDVLKEANVTLAAEDIVIPAPNTPISEARQIDIRRAFDITVSDIDGEKTFKTAHETVGDALLNCGIILDENDETEPPADAKTSKDMHISIARVEITEVVEEQELAYDVIEEESDKYSKGVKKLITSGKNGLANITYRIITKNGEVAAKEEIARDVLQEPINKVIAVGTKEIVVPAAKLASRGGAGVDKTASKVLICRATAYDGSYETLGKRNPKTCLGRTPTVGTVAVDPRVIPLGTRMYIETVDGSYVYGECFAGDTGGAIKGNRVDLFMASRSQALAFGSRQVKVYILD